MDYMEVNASYKTNYIMSLYDIKKVTINSNTNIYLIKMIGQRKTPNKYCIKIDAIFYK